MIDTNKARELLVDLIEPFAASDSDAHDAADAILASTDLPAIAAANAPGLVWSNRAPKSHGYPDEAVDAFGGVWARWWIDGQEHFMPPNRTKYEGMKGSADNHYRTALATALGGDT